MVSPGNSPGIQNVDTFTQTANGILEIEIGGLTPGPGVPNPDDGYDQINVSELATLDGTLSINLINDFVPTLGDTFEILTFSSVTGDFAHFTGLVIGNGLYFKPIVGANSHLLEVSSIPGALIDVPGDVTIFNIKDIGKFTVTARVDDGQGGVDVLLSPRQDSLR